MKKLVLLLVMVGSVAASGCGGGSISSSSSGSHTVQPASFQGSWEFVAVSAADPTGADSATLIEADLQQTNATITSSHVDEFYYEKTGWTPPIQPCNAECVTAISGTVTGASATFTLAIADCYSSPCTFSGSGTISNGTISGTWKLRDGSQVASGTFSALAAAQPSGTYSGALTTCIAPTASGCGSYGKDQASVTFSKSAVTAVLSGTDNGTFDSTLTATSFVGNSISIPSPVSNGASWYGYFDSTGKYTGTKNSIELYAENAGASSGMSMGLLQPN